MSRFLSLLLLGLCAWSVCEVVVVPYIVGAVVAVTVMHALLFVLHVCGVRGRCGCGECVYGWYMWFRCFG